MQGDRQRLYARGVLGVRQRAAESQIDQAALSAALVDMFRTGNDEYYSVSINLLSLLSIKM